MVDSIDASRDPCGNQALHGRRFEGTFGKPLDGSATRQVAGRVDAWRVAGKADEPHLGAGLQQTSGVLVYRIAILQARRSTASLDAPDHFFEGHDAPARPHRRRAYEANDQRR